jgi:serine/threonine-protein kinase
VIGIGAMGIVYAVEHTQTGELLALKVMTSHQDATREAVERFKREARASSKIKSEHVVRVIDADIAPELGSAPYLVMDLLEGTDLERACLDQPVVPAVVVDWLRQVARALDKAHRIGITHRDLKPENLFLTRRDDGSSLIKILDFGIAKIAAESVGTTQSGQILGTPLYMSPEQARGDPARVGPAADLYALGLIAYRLLTGAPYWKATSVAGILTQILFEPMTPPSSRGNSLGAEFDGWFLRACSRSVEERFGSAVEQTEALAKALGVPADTRPEALKSGPSGSNPSAHPELGLAPTLAQSGGTLVSSSSETPRRSGTTTASGKRIVRSVILTSVGIGAVLLVGAVVLLSRRQPTPETAMAVGTAPAAPVAATADSLPTPSAEAAAAAPVPIDSAKSDKPERDTIPPVPSGRPLTRQKEPAKVAHADAAAPSPASARPTLLDPLGDQK